MVDASTSTPEALRCRWAGAGHLADWPGELIQVARVFADPHRVAGGVGPFAGPEQPSGEAEPVQRRPEADPDAETALRMLEASEVSPQIGRLLGAEVCDAIRSGIDAGRPVRLEIAIAPGDPASVIPWELVATADSDQRLSLRPGCSVVRWVDAAERTIGPAERPKELRSAVLDLSDVDDERFDLVRRAASDRAGSSLHLDAATVEPVDVLHVLGHGLQAEAGPGRHEPLVGSARPADLIEHLARVGWPALIVLVACRSAEGGAGLSFAAQLAAAGAPAVVGMAGDVETIGVAPSFVSGLWDAFDRGASIETAVQSGRARVATFGSALSSWQWGLPVLTISTDSLMPARTNIEPEIPGLDELAQLTIEASLNVEGQVDEATIVELGQVSSGRVTVAGRIGKDAVVGKFWGVRIESLGRGGVTLPTDLDPSSE
jgi:hypothetical protein